MKEVFFYLIQNLSLPSFHQIMGLFQSLSDNAQNATPSQLSALGSTIWSAIWGAFQNRLPPTPPTVAGPGIIDNTLYINKITSAGSPEAANRAAAEGIYSNLLPGLGERMDPMVKSMLDLGKK